MITVQSFEVNYFGENTYLLYDETKEAVLIDCGCMRPMEKQHLSDYIREKGLTNILSKPTASVRKQARPMKPCLLPKNRARLSDCLSP